ncbi:MAG: type II and III secretion system protein family protein [Magnetovibrio sp.]|nr:type II and III secretion system protein family protein [Magnetovibrio sp.]
MMFKTQKIIVYSLGALAAFATFASLDVQAQQVPGRTMAVSPPAVSATPSSPSRAPAPITPEWTVNTNSNLVRVPLNKIVSVRLPGKVRNVVIGNPAIADIVGVNDGTRDHVYVLALLVGSTSIIFEDASGNVLFKGDIQVDVDAAGIQAAIAELFPEEKIEVTAQRNSVFLKGFVRSAIASAQAVSIAQRYVANANNIINNLEILGSRQVIMQVHVSEMKRTAIKELGFNFNYSKNLGNAANKVNVAAVGIAKLASTAFATGSILPGITGFGNISYQVLEENGLTKTLAEPALTAASGETATFKAGGTVMLPSGTDVNGNLVYTEKDYGVLLSFTPTVLDRGRINLKISTEVSSLGVVVNNFTSINSNKTQTVINLQSGGSLIISGLIQNNQTSTISGIPGLKDLPILGALFRSEAFNNNETELVVTVTAYLAEPVGNDARLSLPTDGFVSSSDMDLYLLGRLHKQYTKTPLPPYATPLAGPYGYIME